MGLRHLAGAGATGPTTTPWIEGDDPVFEEPVDYTVDVNSVTVGPTVTFMMGSDTIGGHYGNIHLVTDPVTTFDVEVPNSTLYIYAFLDSSGATASSCGLEVSAAANLYLGEQDFYTGNTILNNGSAINFVNYALSTGEIDVEAGTGGSAELSFSNADTAVPITNNIEIYGCTLEVDPEGPTGLTAQSTPGLDGVISDYTGPGTLEIDDSVGGGTVILNPLDANQNPTANTCSGGTVIVNGTLGINADDDLGATTASPNVTFAGNATLQWEGSFALQAPARSRSTAASRPPLIRRPMPGLLTA